MTVPEETPEKTINLPLSWGAIIWLFLGVCGGGSGVAAVGGGTSQEIRLMEVKLGAKIDHLGLKLDAGRARLDKLESKLAEHEKMTGHKKLEEK